jgi:hypothetical protein
MTGDPEPRQDRPQYRLNLDQIIYACRFTDHLLLLQEFHNYLFGMREVSVDAVGTPIMDPSGGKQDTPHAMVSLNSNGEMMQSDVQPSPNMYNGGSQNHLCYVGRTCYEEIQRELLAAEEAKRQRELAASASRLVDLISQLQALQATEPRSRTWFRWHFGRRTR